MHARATPCSDVMTADARDATNGDDPARVAHFRIIGRLGAGGMGVVYRATDEKLRREVALKVLPASVATDPERRARFLREARAAAAVTHANIATVYEIGEADGHGFIAMELLRGATLRERMSAGLAPDEAMRIAREVARGLAAAHEKGIVHRDLKPENVMITSDGSVKILDFGIAKRLGNEPLDVATATTEDAAHATAEGRIIGTPAYMSPEQAQGRADVDARSDVFSFGSMLYEMLAGTPPFRGQTSLAILVAVLHDEPKPLDVVCPDAPPSAPGIVARCLVKQAEDRFASGREILAALDPTVRAEPAADPRNEELAQTASATALAATGLVDVGLAKTEIAPPRAPRRSARQLYVIAAACLVAGGAVTGLAPSSHSPSARTAAAPSAPASAEATAAASVTRIVDLPKPKTGVPAAAAEYTSGIQAIHDDDWAKAEAHFAKAIELDPGMALGHLRHSMAMLVAQDPDRRRASYGRAVGLRTQLEERDAALLEAMQPFLQSATQDRPETERRLQALLDRYPRDVELWMWLGLTRYGTPEAIAPASRAVELDPADAQSWETKGNALFASGRAAESLDAFERCSAVSAHGADCYGMKGYAELLLGRCAEAEKDSRRAADRNPYWESFVAWNSAASSPAPSAFDALIARGAKASPLSPTGQAIMVALEQAGRAILFGDFARAGRVAKKALADLEADATSRSIYFLRYAASAALVDVALETGDLATARHVATDFVARRAEWAQDTALGHGIDLSLAMARAAHAPDEPAPMAFAAARRAWIDARIADGADRSHIWSYAYAATAWTPHEAEEALGALPEFGAPATVAPIGLLPPVGSPDADLGRVELLAGKTDLAITHLTRAVASCDLFASARSHVRAALDLGHAHEAKGQNAAACAAYGAVMAQWGDAKPKSLTATLARARAKELGCPAP